MCKAVIQPVPNFRRHLFTSLPCLNCLPSPPCPLPCVAPLISPTMQKQSKSQRRREQRQREEQEREARIAAELAELGDTGGWGA